MMHTFFRNRNNLVLALNANSATSASISQLNTFIACGRFKS